MPYGNPKKTKKKMKPMKRKKMTYAKKMPKARPAGKSYKKMSPRSYKEMYK